MSELFAKTQYTTLKKTRQISCSIQGFDDMLALQMTSQDTPNTQIEFSLAAETYILDFGEKLSPLTLSGTFPKTEQCTKSKVKHRLSELYNKHRLGKEAVVVTVGDDAYTCYVTGKSVSVSSERPELINFSVSFLGYKGGGGEDGGKDDKVTGESPGIGSRNDSAFDLGGIGSIGDNVTAGFGGTTRVRESAGAHYFQGEGNTSYAANTDRNNWSTTPTNPGYRNVDRNLRSMEFNTTKNWKGETVYY